MEPKFKIGDKLRCKNQGGYKCITTGKIYDFLGYESSSPSKSWPRIICDDGKEWFFEPSVFELFEAKFNWLSLNKEFS